MSVKVITERLCVATAGEGQVVDLTRKVSAMVDQSGLKEGQALIFAPGATAGVTTLEFEPGLVQDFPELFERLAPRDHAYHHDQTWGDGNGHAHLRASLLGPSLTVPVAEGALVLGDWQQLVLVDFDTRPRQRQLVVQLSGIFGRTR